MDWAFLEQKYSKYERDLAQVRFTIASLKMKGPCVKECGWLEELRAASKETGASVLQLQGTEFH